jgi:transposase
VEDLRRSLGRNSQNSSKPPSSDPPHLKLGPGKKPSGRKPGGQPGHRGKRRELLPVDQVDVVFDHWPAVCAGCAHPFPGKRHDDDGGERHQVTELPPLKPVVTEHVLHGQGCLRCGAFTRSDLPMDVPRGAFGVRLQATIAAMSGQYRMSKRNIAALCATLFGIDISVGAISTIEQRVSAALARPVEDLRRFVQRQSVVSADETSWSERRKRAWLWVASTPAATVFMVHRRRNKEAAQELLGSFAGRLVRDRWPAYDEYDARAPQICWAHLKRDFQWLSEHDGVTGAIGGELLALYGQVFAAWAAYRRGTIQRPTLRRRVGPLRRELTALLQRGVHEARGRPSGMCKDMLKFESGLWSFIDAEGVPPTNNGAEQALRPAVIWRKTSYGTHSFEGSRFVERILSAVTTLKQQGRQVLDYLVSLMRAAAAGRRTPELLPG